MRICRTKPTYAPPNVRFSRSIRFSRILPASASCHIYVRYVAAATVDVLNSVDGGLKLEDDKQPTEVAPRRVVDLHPVASLAMHPDLELDNVMTATF